MKKITMLFALVLIAGAAYSQEVRVNTYAGYVFDDKVDSYYSSSSYYEGKILGGFRWGAGIEYQLPNTTKAFELQYLRQDTSAPIVYQDGGILGGQIQNTEFDLAANWIMLNGTNYFPVSEVAEPFFGFGIGMVISDITNPDNGNNDGATKFAWALRGGSNFWLAEKVGIRIQASLMSAVQGAGGGLYFGTGGAGAGVSTYSTIYQFAFDGGLVFRFPQ
ncbi:porin family protein [Algoriphagus aestuariicola]|uniref:Porin family protein n=1 Tax=Algoriphagus aestuariicola TaxID=1852016 RepID=A0ABS3BLG7_9BACT|nr:porin family protein [Algoriphagus aestuariicola]MBN7799852.1 porin family protein [Algoriphagus aestuariicola]